MIVFGELCISIGGLLYCTEKHCVVSDGIEIQGGPKLNVETRRVFDRLSLGKAVGVVG